MNGRTYRVPGCGSALAHLRDWPQTEEATLRLGRSRVAEGSGPPPIWNHAEFSVRYRSLEGQLCIGGVYVKLLLDGADKVRLAWA